MLIKRTQQQPRRSPLPALPAAPTGDSTVAASCTVQVSRPAAWPRSAPCRSVAVRKRQGRPAAASRRDGDETQECLHALLGRLHGDCRGRQWRVDRPGAGLGHPDQSWLALLQGSGGARRRAQ